MSISKRIRTLRHFLNLDQKTFCKAVGLSQAQLSRIENEKQQGLDFQAVLSIISVYNVNAKWLKGDIGEDDKPIFNSKLSEDEIQNTIKEKEDYKNKLLMVQEQLLNYQTSQIQTLKNIEDVSK